jgi:hypothetical protein
VLYISAERKFCQPKAGCHYARESGNIVCVDVEDCVLGKHMRVFMYEVIRPWLVVLTVDRSQGGMEAASPSFKLRELPVCAVVSCTWEKQAIDHVSNLARQHGAESYAHGSHTVSS